MAAMDVGGVDGEDAFDSVLSICHVSFSQEELLQRCDFAPERYNPRNDDDSSPDSGEGGIRMASTPIRLVSLPDSEENEFHTPPEEAAMSSSSEIRPIAESYVREEGVVDQQIEERNGGSDEAVDLSRDSELGFSQVEADKIEKPDSIANQVISEVLNVGVSGLRVSTMEISSGTHREESPMKNLEVEPAQQEKSDPDENQVIAEVFNVRVSGISVSTTEISSGNDRGISPLKNSEVKAVQQEKSDSDENLVLAEVFNVKARENRGLTRELASDTDLGESPLKKLKISEESADEQTKVSETVRGASRNPVKRKLDLGNDENPEEDSRLNNVENSGASRVCTKEFLEAIENLREDCSVETQETREDVRRTLPPLFLGQAENVAMRGKDGESQRELTIWDALKLLVEDCDDETVNCSFLDIGKRRGMIISRPAW